MTTNSNQGFIKIDLKKLGHFGDDTISGNLFINILQPYNGHIVVVSLEGIEQISYPNSKTNLQDYEYAIKRFINQYLPIQDLSTFSQFSSFSSSQTSSDNFILQPGQWNIPFSFQMPKKSLSTMNLYEDFYHNCCVNFYICAYIIPNDDIQQPIIGNQRIIIQQNQPIEYNPIQQNMSITPTRFCFIGTGKLLMQCFLDKNQFTTGEEIKLRLKYDFTKFEKNVKNMSIKLIGKLSMKSEKKNKNFIEEYEELSFNEEICFKQGTSDVNFKIPYTCVMSSSGQIHKLEYYISVTPVIENKPWSYIKPLKLGIQIVSSDSYLKSLILPQRDLPKNMDKFKILPNIQAKELTQNQQKKFKDLQQQLIQQLSYQQTSHCLETRDII